MNSPINADGTEIEDAGCTHHHIQGDKDVTVDFAKAPFSHYLEEKKNTNKGPLTMTVNTTKPLHSFLLQQKAILTVKSAVFFYSYLFILLPYRNRKREGIKSKTEP